MKISEFITRPGQGKSWELGGVIQCLVAGEKNADAYSVLLITLDHEQGAPLHIHQREDEVFHILDGVCTFGVGDEIITAETGSTVTLKKGMPHFFRNDGKDPMKAIITAIPGGLDRYFEEVTFAITTEKVDDIDVINKKYEIEFL